MSLAAVFSRSAESIHNLCVPLRPLWFKRVSPKLEPPGTQRYTKEMVQGFNGRCAAITITCFLFVRRIILNL
jgi:hypothetical protein